MEKSTGDKKINSAVFISGTGSNLKNLLNFSFKKNSPIKINLILSSKQNAKGLKYAERYKVKKKNL